MGFRWLGLLLALPLALSCATAKENKEENAKFEEKVQVYADDLNSNGGIVELEKCDSITFSALAGAHNKVNFDLNRFMPEPGLIVRRTIDQPDCFETRKSNGERMSTHQCSRDGYLSAMVWLHHNPGPESLQIASDIWDRGSKNDWVMCPGEGDDRNKFSKSLIGTLAWLIHRLGGEGHSERNSLLHTVALGPVIHGYERALGARHAYLRAELTGRMVPGNLAILYAYAKNSPKNPLFWTVIDRYDNGDQTRAIGLLMDEAQWPTHATPTTANHCDEWPTQRDHREKDWGPCVDPETGPKKHSGGELLWLAAIMEKPVPDYN